MTHPNIWFCVSGMLRAVVWRSQGSNRCIHECDCSDCDEASETCSWHVEPDRWGNHRRLLQTCFNALTLSSRLHNRRQFDIESRRTDIIACRTMCIGKHTCKKAISSRTPYCITIESIRESYTVPHCDRVYLPSQGPLVFHSLLYLLSSSFAQFAANCSWGIELTPTKQNR